MKTIIRCIPLLLLLNCSEQADPVNESSILLKEVQVAGKVNDSYSYDGTRLVQESSFNTSCTPNTPTFQMTYAYDGTQLAKVTSFLTASSLACNPSLDIKSEQVLEYDAAGRITKVITGTASYTLFEYNSNNQVIRQSLYSPNGTLFSSTAYSYDSRGNLIEEKGSNGNTTYYEYDDKKNPYFYMNQRPQWISAFNKSPNNVIKATGGYNFERQFRYNSDGFPVEVNESNGLTYNFIYR